MHFRLFFVLLLLVCILARVKSQICCTPDQWEGFESTMTGIVKDGKAELTKTSTYLYYDFSNLRVASFSNVTNSTGSSTVFLLKFYSNTTTGTQYSYDLDTKQCTRSTIQGPFQKECIPDYGTKVRDLTFGIGSNVIEATEYHLWIQPEIFEATVSATRDSCMPITVSVSGLIDTTTGESLMRSVEFSDVKPGISHPDVFKIPKECEQAALTSTQGLNIPTHYGILSL